VRNSTDGGGTQNETPDDTGAGGTGSSSGGTPNPTPGNPSIDPTAGGVSAAPVVASPAAIPTVNAALWTLGETAYPWPNPDATPKPNTRTPIHALPVVIPNTIGQSAFILNSSTVLGVGKAIPTVVSGLNTSLGALYGDLSEDGLASHFLFGSSSAADAQLGFDARFGIRQNSTPAPHGTSVFKFAAVQFNGPPTVDNNNGQANMAIIGKTGVKDGGGGGTWNVDGLRNLFIGTENGSINLSRRIDFSTSNSVLQILHFYGRGGDVTLDGTYNLPSVRMMADATGNVVFGTNSTMNVEELFVNGIGGVQLLGNVTSDYTQIWSTGAVTVDGAITSDTLYSKSGSVILGQGASITGDELSFQTSGDFEAGGSNSLIRANETLLLKIGGVLELNTTQGNQTRLDISGLDTLKIQAGTINLRSDLTIGQEKESILLVGSGGLNGAGYSITSIDKLAIEGGSGTLANLETNYLTVNGGNMTLSGNLTVGQAAVTGDLTVNGTISPLAGGAVTELRSIKAGNLQAGNLDFRGRNSASNTDAPTAGYSLSLVSPGSVTFDSANLNGGDAALAGTAEGGNGGVIHVGTGTKPVGGDITVKQSITATSGANAASVATGGNGGKVSLVANGTVKIEGAIKVSDSAAGRASKQGGNIRIESRKTSDTAINITNSGQLLSLLSAGAPGPGGKVEFVSSGGAISVNGGTLQADKGAINIINKGAGNIDLANATLRGDVVKANVMGTNGQLTIGGGSIDADTAIKLYASGSQGRVLFNDNVSLNGTSVKTIAGSTVTINDGKVVTVNGPSAARVYTNKANYSGSGGNGSTSGAFGGKGATTQSFRNRPSY
jgi:hypothetical protein